VTPLCCQKQVLWNRAALVAEFLLARLPQKGFASADFPIPVTKQLLRVNMYSLLYRAQWRRDWAIEAPCLIVSVLLAEALYKFHSFSLECLAFLATWYVLGGLVYGLRRLAIGSEK
jgi:hypothetical protein